MSVLKKRDSAMREQAPAAVQLKGDSFAKKLPGLVEFLTLATYEDGSARVPGTLTIFADGCWVKACLSDRDQGLVAFASSDSFTGLLEALELGLQGDTLEWRPQQQKGGKRK